METVPIVFAFDNNLVLPACICISSLLMNAKEDIFYDIFILHSSKVDLHKEQLDELPNHFKCCRIQYRVVDNTFDQAFEIRGITAATYYRLLIPELIPEYDKVIYADVDIIFRMDLSELYNTEIGDNYIVCKDKIYYLPMEYNMTDYSYMFAMRKRSLLQNLFSEEEIDDALKQGNIHYNGHKPWKKYSVNFDIWWEYYRKSPFFDEKFYFEFFYTRLNELDQLSLWKRIKILIRYFVYGKREI